MNAIHRLFAIIILILLSYSVHAKEKLEGKQWEMIELTYSTKKVPTESPLEVIMGCVFTHENGTSRDVPGFYNGNSEWVIRFTPKQAGRWQGSTYSSLTELSGKSVELTIDGPDPGSQGGVVINPDDPTHFQYENGDSYFLMAFELDWLFALDYGDPELTKTRQFVKDIRENGFNQIIMNVYAFDVRWPKDPNLKPEHDYGSRLDIYPFKGTNAQPDHSNLNLDFFQHLDRVIKLLDDSDIVAHLMIYVWNKEVNWPEAYSANDNRYFDYVVKRYQSYNNILWDISKEALGYGHNDINYITDRIQRLRKLDAHDRLVTVHDITYCSKFPEQVDFISVQSWTTDIYNHMRNLATRFDNKPIFNIEHGGYEQSPYEVFIGNYNDPATCLRRNYICAFAKTYTTYYWQGSSWNVIVPDPFAATTEPQPKFKYYKHMYDFFQKYPYSSFEPAQKYCSSGWCMTNGEDTYLYYVPSENVAVDIRRLPETKTIQLMWFDPLTGEYSEVEERPWNWYLRIKKPKKGVDEILVVKGK